MAKRPLIYVPWATEALPADIGDADTFVPENPGYPEQQPNQYKNGWSVTPRTVVKQPHQWVNAWLQQTDLQLLNWYAESFGWIMEIPYAVGAIAYYGGKRWVCKVANTNNQPDLNPALWEEAKYYSDADARADLAYWQARTKEHIDNKNDPHNITYVQISGASTSEIDSWVTALTNAINSHKGLTNNPHNVTYDQLNILPKTGGTFSGQVGMLRYVGAQGDLIQHVSSTFAMHANGSHLGIDRVRHLPVKDGEELLTFDSYEKVRRRNTIKFTPPIPDVSLPLVADIHAKTGSYQCEVNYVADAGISYTDKSGNAQTTVADEPAFGTGGLQIRAGKGQVLSLVNAPTGIIGTVFGILDGVPIAGIGALVQSNVLEYFPPGLELKDLRIWGYPLTPYQIAALGVTS